MSVSQREQAQAATRFNVRPLTVASADAVRAELETLEAGPEGLASVGRHGALDAIAIEGLDPGQTRALGREAGRGGAVVITSPEGDRALLLGPVATIGELPTRLADWGRATQELGAAMAAALTARGTLPAPLKLPHGGLPVGERTMVMGIVNVSPDSFAGDGIDSDPAAAARRAVEHVAAGADLIDVGAESSRPGSSPVEIAEELRRLIPALASIREVVAVPISVDTRRAEVARAAIDAGAAIVNDSSGLSDPVMLATIAPTDVALILTHRHSVGEAAGTMRRICHDLRSMVAAAIDADVHPTRLLIDPGFGLAKSADVNGHLLRGLTQLRALGRGIVISVSRRPTIDALTGRAADPTDRLAGSVALATLSAAAGVDILRAHDVRATVDAARIADALGCRS